MGQVRRRGAVELLEEEVAELLGKPAAVFFVSGTMAQQAMLRVWCERRGSQRVAIPDLSHLLTHETDGPRLMHGLRFEHLTEGRVTATGDDLRAIPGPGARRGPDGAAVARGRLPAADLGGAHGVLRGGPRARGAVPRRRRPAVGGAAVLRPALAEIPALVDSVYVSFYKGLRAMSGAAVAGEQDVADELRAWRQRMGGTLFRMSPYAVSALVGLRDRLPLIGEYVAWAGRFAAELVAAGLRVNPDPPHMNTFEVFADSPLPELKARLATLMEREKVQPSGTLGRERGAAGCRGPRCPATSRRSGSTPPRWPAGIAEVAGRDL